jgi:hypothetical protein
MTRFIEIENLTAASSRCCRRKFLPSKNKMTRPRIIEPIFTFHLLLIAETRREAIV